MPSSNPNALASLLEYAISACSSLFGRAVHAQVIRTLQSPLPSFLANYLINMYSKLNLPNSALLVLRHSPNRTVVTWTALISGSVQNGHVSFALLHFSNMLRENIHPNDFTFPCVFKASGLLRLSFVGKQAHAIAVKLGEANDVFVGCSAFDMYSKCGLEHDAHKLFDELPQKNVATWNAYICNSVTDGRPKNAVHAFIEFRQVGGEPDPITFCAFLNACADQLNLDLGRQLHGFVIRSGYESEVSVLNGLIDFYGKCKETRWAEMIFGGMEIRNAVTWCCIVAAFEQNDEEEKACVFFREGRKEGVELTDYLVSSVLSACAGLSGLEMGRTVQALALKVCLVGDIFVGSALVDMYGKCGSIKDSEQAFHDMSDRNLVTWNAMISGYAHQGIADSAIKLFELMTSDVEPNYVTLVCVLSACSRAGAVEMGMEIFDSMRDRYNIEPVPEHYACVVDLLGRAGMVEFAYDFVQRMPFPPSIEVWGALLNACRVHNKPELGKIAADKLFELDPKDSGNHVLLSNMFATAGRWEEAALVRKEMMDVGIKKGAGYSWLTAKNRVHVFQAKDTSHAMNSEIQAMLVKLRMEIEATGYIPDTSCALYDLEEEEKINEVWHHSEKIALAFGYIAIPPGLPIRITKNLRICGDCHSAFKFISGVIGREIIVRDNSRFHCFRNSQCSCKDYW